ncbi:MAG: DNA-3-methyladenine glycosylase [Candidatus Asgardarchaeia archaeon]
MYKPIPRQFYNRHTVEVAKDLLGHFLVRKLGDKYLVGKIVEVEAYRGEDDPGSHAYRGITPRTKIMFGEPGHAYVYLIYGMYYCLNVTTEPEGQAGAVLFRAIEPIKGIEIMKANRKVNDIRKLTSGPARLTLALRIDKSLNGIDMTKDGPLFIAENPNKENFEIVETTRIGIKVGLDKLWRFYIKGNLFVSKK